MLTFKIQVVASGSKLGQNTTVRKEEMLNMENISAYILPLELGLLH